MNGGTIKRAVRKARALLEGMMNVLWKGTFAA